MFLSRKGLDKSENLPGRTLLNQSDVCLVRVDVVRPVESIELLACSYCCRLPVKGQAC